MARVLLCFIWLVIIPLIIGMLITKFMNKEKNNLFYSIIIGYFIEFAIYQIFTIPFTFKKQSFSSLYYTCFGIFTLLCIVSIIVNRKELKHIFKKFVDSIKETPKILTLIVCLIIGVQCYYEFSYMHIDEDDSNYVAKATVTWQTDTLYVYEDTGEEYTEYPVRYIFSPFPVYTASVAKFTGFHPMGIAHNIFPVGFLILMYITYYLLGLKLFKDDKRCSLIFLLFINIIYLFGDDGNLHSNFRFALVRLWQGKAILGNLIIPAIIVIYNSFIESKTKLIYWLTLLLTMFASCFVSTMGVALGFIIILALTIIYSFGSIEIKNPFKLADIKTSIVSFLRVGILSLLCVFPNILYAVLHALEKGGQ